MSAALIDETRTADQNTDNFRSMVDPLGDYGERSLGQV
jgi:hypothetical protein